MTRALLIFALLVLVSSQFFDPEIEDPAPLFTTKEEVSKLLVTKLSFNETALSASEKELMTIAAAIVETCIEPLVVCFVICFVFFFFVWFFLFFFFSFLRVFDGHVCLPSPVFLNFFHSKKKDRKDCQKRNDEVNFCFQHESAISVWIQVRVHSERFGQVRLFFLFLPTLSGCKKHCSCCFSVH